MDSSSRAEDADSNIRQQQVSLAAGTSEFPIGKCMGRCRRLRNTNDYPCLVGSADLIRTEARFRPIGAHLMPPEGWEIILAHPTSNLTRVCQVFGMFIRTKLKIPRF